MYEVLDPCYYSVLQVDVNASSSVIARAYRSKALQFHPDKNPTALPEQFQAITEAYEVLSDPEKRQLYDYYGPTLKPRLSEAFARLAPLLLPLATGFIGSSVCTYDSSLSARAACGYEVGLMGVAGVFYCYRRGAKDSAKPQTKPQKEMLSLSDYVTITSVGLLIGNVSGWAASSIVLLCKAIVFGS
uniref:J domain-containing protein n=1 Tax=Peronospora matthiolae TaxID=2874970 RepID=A0AAV1TRJ5_9STRA